MERWRDGGVMTVSKVVQELDQGNQSKVEDVDYKVLVVEVCFQNTHIKGVLLDGGSGLNILPKSMCKRLGIIHWDDTPFQVKMADQRRVQPLGTIIWYNVQLAGLDFAVNFVVLRLEESTNPYPMILGSPWLRVARVKQDWGADQIALRKGKKKMKLNIGSKISIPKAFRPLSVETINMVLELQEDEEEEFFRRKPSMVPIFEVDIE